MLSLMGMVMLTNTANEEVEEEEKSVRGCRVRAGGGGGGELPEDCIAKIISPTSPRDACRLCLVSTIFRSAAESDAVWGRFLPPGYLSAISRAVEPSSLPCSSKKDLYLSLCDQPLLIDEGRKSFSLDKESGKICYMLSARELSIIWGDTPRYWRWIPLPESRFEDVAELISVCWLEIRGKISIRLLSPSTLYAANLVFRTSMGSYGFEHQPVEAAVGLAGGETSVRSFYLDAETERRLRYQIVPRRMGLYFRNRSMESKTSTPKGGDNDRNHPKERGDGWMEIELGEFFYDGGQEGELEMSVMEVEAGNWKGGLIVQGIEIRPKKV